MFGKEEYELELKRSGGEIAMAVLQRVELVFDISIAVLLELARDGSDWASKALRGRINKIKSEIEQRRDKNSGECDIHSRVDDVIDFDGEGRKEIPPDEIVSESSEDSSSDTPEDGNLESGDQQSTESSTSSATTESAIEQIAQEVADEFEEEFEKEFEPAFEEALRKELSKNS